MKRLSSRERALLWVCLVTVAGFCLLVFLVKPMVDRSSDLSSQIRRQRSALEEARLAKRRIEALNKEIKELQTRVAKAARKGSDLGPVLLKELEALSSRSQLRLAAIHPVDPTVQEGLRRYPFELEFDAPFPEFTQFLFNLEAPEHSLFLERAEIRPAYGAAAMVHAKLRVAAYSVLTPEEEEQAPKGRLRRMGYGG